MDRSALESMWTHLHWLTVLDQHRSYTRAAERLQVSKAAVSQKIAELERAAGVQLVQRTTRSVRLTQAGSSLAAAARHPFEQLAAALGETRELAGEPAGLLRVTAPVAFSRQHLGPLLAEFSRRHPRVRVELDLSDALRSLAVEGYDLAVRHTQEPPETHVAWRLAATRTLLVASPQYLRRHGTPASPADLAAHACLHYPRRDATPTWSFADAGRAPAGGKQGDVVTVAVRGPLAVNNSEVLRDAALAGQGIALVPDFSVQAAVQAGKLVSLLEPYRSIGAFGDWLYAIRPYSPHVPASVRALVTVLQEAFAEGFKAG